jgi:hypothetical protein
LASASAFAAASFPLLKNASSGVGFGTVWRVGKRVRFTGGSRGSRGSLPDDAEASRSSRSLGRFKNPSIPRCPSSSFSSPWNASEIWCQLVDFAQLPPAHIVELELLEGPDVLVPQPAGVFDDERRVEVAREGERRLARARLPPRPGGEDERLGPQPGGDGARLAQPDGQLAGEDAEPVVSHCVGRHARDRVLGREHRLGRQLLLHFCVVDALSSAHRRDNELTRRMLYTQILSSPNLACMSSSVVGLASG